MGTDSGIGYISAAGSRGDRRRAEGTRDMEMAIASAIGDIIGRFTWNKHGGMCFWKVRIWGTWKIGGCFYLTTK